MAKKKNFFSAYGGAIILLLTVATFIMLFLTNVKYVEGVLGTAVETNGLSAVFTWKNADTDIVLSGFNILALLAYVLPIGALVFSLLFGKGKIMNVIVLACFVASAIFFFLMPSTMPLSDAGKLVLMGRDATLGIGAILGGIFSAVSALVTLLRILVK